MRYISALLYATAIAAGMGKLLDSLMIGACIFLGTVGLVFAVEGIVRHELWRAAHPERMKPTRLSWHVRLLRRIEGEAWWAYNFPDDPQFGSVVEESPKPSRPRRRPF